MNIFKKFNFGLKKTSTFLSSNLLNALSAKKIDKNTLEKIESILLSTDLGLEITNHLIRKIESFRMIMFFTHMFFQHSIHKKHFFRTNITEKGSICNSVVKHQMFFQEKSIQH